MRSLIAILSTVLVVAACDPVYTLGARTQFTPAPTTGCVGASLKASPRYAEVQPLDPHQGTGFRLTLHDSALAGRGGKVPGWRHVTLRVESAGTDSASAVSLAYVWLGGAESVPLGVQRQLLVLAADVLGDLRAACAPGAPSPVVECFARGLGGAPACRPTT